MSEESELYKACCADDLEKVKSLLERLSLDEIDRIEPNGSTALHASCHYGHLDIVKALLRCGASRRQMNGNNRTPGDEAYSEQIKALFRRPSTNADERFVSKMPDIEWMIAGAQGFQTACDNIFLSKKFATLQEANQVISNAKDLQGAEGMDQIRRLLVKAQQTKDITYLVRAYTAETDFYKVLNSCHAQLSSHGYTEEERDAWFVKYGKTLHKSEQLDKYRWTGTTYRGIYLNDNALDQYNIGDYIVNKAFLSTSKSRHVAERFISISSLKKVIVVCVYYLRKNEYVLDISSISEYPEEEEVLILPNACFKVESIKRQVCPIEIELSSW